ncbi:hypothetical protein [Catenovulum sediminis]|uniref:hypothetical protein n=1 Tax=Catenovulum sediminis TaxID=1740262 RepID=UPI00118127F3|nr:hypothetical protein [Catenovulum sediminis]
MATLIQKTVSSSYLNFAGYAPVVAANTEFEIEYLFRFDNSNDYGRVVGNGSGYVSRILHWHNGSDAIRITDHSGTSYDFSPSYTHTDLVKFKFVRGADMKISLHIDDVFVEKSNVVISGEFRFEYFFRQSNAVANVHMSLGYFKVDVNGSPFLHFSPDDSDTSNTGSQPVVTELINGYDAAGQSFATDGSVWHVENTAEAVTVTLEPAEQLNEGAILSAVEQVGLTLSAGEQLNEGSILSAAEQVGLTLSAGEQLNEGSILSAAEQVGLTLSAGEQLNEGGQQKSALNQVFSIQPAQQLNEGSILSAAEQVSLTLSAGEQLNEGGQQQSALNQVFAIQPAQQLNEGEILSAAEQISLTLSAGEQQNQASQLTLIAPLDLVIQPAQQQNQASQLSSLANQTFVMRQSEQLNQFTQLTTATTGVFVAQPAEQLNEGGAQQSPIQMQFVIQAAEQLNQAISALLSEGIPPVVITSAKVINKSYSASLVQTSYTAHLIKNQLTARVK